MTIVTPCSLVQIERRRRDLLPPKRRCILDYVASRPIKEVTASTVKAQGQSVRNSGTRAA